MQAARPDEDREEIEANPGDRPTRVLVVRQDGLGAPRSSAHHRADPPPAGRPDAPAAVDLIFDSKFDDYQGVGPVRPRRRRDPPLGQKIPPDGGESRARGPGPGPVPARTGSLHELGVGQVGYVVANIKRLSDVRIGDTITDASRPAEVALPGYQEPKQVVYCGLFPATHNQFEDLRTALQKLALNDSSFTFEPETSDALGFGFRCGFLGMLHMEIVQQRLERESNLSLVQTAPNVTYEIVNKRGEVGHISNPTRIPDPGEIEEFREPLARVNFILPADSIGAIMQLCEDRRGTYQKTEYITPTRAILTYELPLAEMIYDLYDKLKSATRGYGTMDYEVIGYQGQRPLPPRHPGQRREGRRPVDRRPPPARRPPRAEARQEAPRRDRAPPVRGGHPGRHRQQGHRPRDDLGPAQERHGQVLRRRHHPQAQAPGEAEEGKKRMKQVGNVEISQEAFLSVLDDSDE
jgi:GTP-binding protein LepA